MHLALRGKHILLKAKKLLQGLDLELVFTDREEQ